MLLLVAVELITMPITQQFWAWDGFVRGEPDFELGLLMIVMCVCLGLLRAQHGRVRVSCFLAIRRLAETWCGRRTSTLLLTFTVPLATGEPAASRSHNNSATPLLI